MAEKTTLGPTDVEVEHTNAGTIIHIFPETRDAKQVVKDIMQGLYLLHHYNTLPDHESVSLLKESENYSAVFFNKIKYK